MNAAAASVLEGLSADDRAVVEEALRLSAPALAADPTRLPSQLVGRLGGSRSAAIRALVDRLRPQAPLCPVGASLEAPGSPLLLTLTHHTEFDKLYSFLSIALIDGGRKAIAGQVLEALTMWDLQAGGTAVEFEGDVSGVYGLHVSQDERRAYTVGYADEKKVGGIGIWDIAAKKQIGMIPNTPGKLGGYIDSMILLPGDRQAVTADSDGRIETWDLEARTRLKELVGPRKDDEEAWLPVIHRLPDGSLLVAQHHPSADESRVSILNVDSGEKRLLVSFPGKLGPVKVHAASRRFLVSPDTLRVHDLDTGRLLATFRGDSDIDQMKMSDDGRTILAGENTGRVHVLRVQV